MRPRLTTSLIAIACVWSGSAEAQSAATFNRLATFPVAANLPADRDPGKPTVAEIVAASADGGLLVYTDSQQKGVGLVDIADPAAPKPAGFVPLDGEPTSVAILGDTALVAVVTSESKAEPAGQLAVVDLQTKRVEATCDLGGQPDSVALTPDRGMIAVVVENERDEEVAEGKLPQLPSGALAVLNIAEGAPDCASLRRVELTGLADVAPEDAEPEFVDINESGEAVVSLQENNHLAVVDLATGAVTAHFSAGQVDLEGVDTEEDGVIRPDSEIAGVAREPDAVQWLDADRFVTANEGDYQGGSRGFTIFRKDGEVLFDAGAEFERLAMRLGHYPEGRSDAKGTEPEGLEVASFGADRLIFVGSERGSFVAVYRDTGGAPEYLQALPTGIGPEGLIAIPARDLLVVANEEDLVEDGGARATVMIYRRGEGPAAYPTIVAASDAPIGWGALSGLAADPERAGRLFAVTDSAYGTAQILEIDATKRPAEIVRALTLTEDGAPVDGLDLEGIAAAPGGGFWVASEGDPKKELANRLLKVSAAGEVESVVELPEALTAQATASGLEGVTLVGSGDDATLWLAVQREWGDDEKGVVKLLSYRPATQRWGVVRYPLDAATAGWVGLSEITATPDGRLLLVERDNQIGEAAAAKRLYAISLDGVTPAAPGETAPLVEKELVRDLLGDLRGAHGYVLDKGSRASRSMRPATPSWSPTMTASTIRPARRCSCRSGRWRGSARSAPQNDPDGVHDARQVAEQRQQDVQPEMQAEADLQEHAERRQQDGEQDADHVAAGGGAARRIVRVAPVGSAAPVAVIGGHVGLLRLSRKMGGTASGSVPGPTARSRRRAISAAAP